MNAAVSLSACVLYHQKQENIKQRLVRGGGEARDNPLYWCRLTEALRMSRH